MKTSKLKFLFCVGLLALPGQAAPITFTSSGANPAAIQATVDAFRLALGTLNANVAGSFGTGRREINWDGVPDTQAAPNPLAANFFNVTSPRGVIFTTPGTGFAVSASVTSGTAVEFGDINAAYPASFQTFSTQRLFTSLGSQIYDVFFLVPGSATPAFTSAFGAVFTDVDLANTTSIQYFDVNNISLGTYFAPTADSGVSFLGVQFDAGEQIGRVRVTLGNNALGPVESQSLDVVVADDFIYAEPNAVVPEPASWWMLTLGGAGLAFIRNRRPGKS